MLRFTWATLLIGILVCLLSGVFSIILLMVVMFNKPKAVIKNVTFKFIKGVVYFYQFLVMLTVFTISLV
jgi:hypothetical protein